MSSLNDEDRANLAAFLDGELDEASSQALEAKIHRDPEARAEVESLKRAWSMLDFLPRPEPSPNFTNRTMERLTLIVPRAQSTQLVKKPRPVGWPFILAWLGAALIALLASVGVGRFLWRNSPPETPTYALPSDDWLSRQPKAQRDQAAQLQGKEREDFIKTLHQAEQQREREWQEAQRSMDEVRNKELPSRRSELPSEMLGYLNRYLWYMLTPEERERLDRAEGNWPLYPQTLVELADKNPPALLGPTGFRNLDELPQDVRSRLGLNKAAQKALTKHENQWPGFAIAVSDLAYHKTGKNPAILPYELWATHEKCLLTPMREFLNKKLRPALTEEENRYLNKAIGKWPEFPRAIQELAHAHKLQPPWFTIPGPREQWDNYRIHKAREN